MKLYLSGLQGMLYVSLLIFVYSLMDSDERASLQKKMF